MGEVFHRAKSPSAQIEPASNQTSSSSDQDRDAANCTASGGRNGFACHALPPLMIRGRFPAAAGKSGGSGSNKSGR
jgi:hypothetical protein